MSVIILLIVVGVIYNGVIVLVCSYKLLNIIVSYECRFRVYQIDVVRIVDVSRFVEILLVVGI